MQRFTAYAFKNAVITLADDKVPPMKLYDAILEGLSPLIESFSKKQSESKKPS